MGARLPLGGASPADVMASYKGTKFLYIMGWAKYFDVFPDSREHITRFCYLIEIMGDPTGPMNTFAVGFTPFIRNNCADDGCNQ
jgi:hypothetical protein